MQRVGPYEVVRELGRGAMGVVFEVRHPSSADRLALKMILQPDPNGLERFRREADVLSYLGRHTHIVGFREAGVEGGHPYIVMDFVEGKTLHEALQRGEVSTDHAVRILIGVARALHFAHEAQVIHRDVKPANILIDAGGRAYLSDFGVAKSLQADRLTLTGELVGTPAYMAPEQLEGGRSIDRRADVYALGAVLYEVLTGVRPFAGDKISIVKKILMDPAPRPGAHSASPPPPELEALCLECLAKAPADRPPSAEVFARRLEAYLGEGGFVEEGSRRGTPPALVAVLLVLAVAVGALGGRVSAATPTPAATPTEAVAPDPLTTARNLCFAVRTDPKAAAGTAPQLIAAAEGLLASVDSKRDADAGRVELAWDCLVAALVLTPDAETGEALKALDGLRAAPAADVRRAASPLRALWRDDGLLLGPEVLERALAIREVEATVSAAKREEWPLPLGVAAQAISSHTDWWDGRYVMAQQRCRVFAELALRRPRLRVAQFELGMALFQVGRWREACVVLERAVAEDPGPQSWYRLSRVLQRVGRPAEAERFSREGLKRGGEKRGRGWHALHFVEVLLEQGGRPKLEEAKALLEQSGLKGHWRWVQLRRAVGQALGEPLESYWPDRERGLRINAINRWLTTKRLRFPEPARIDVYPKASK